MRRVALITSGGDGAGINSMIEMLSRNKEIDLYGFHDGYDGILANQPIHLTQANCENHSLDGTHFLRTARSKLPYTKKMADNKLFKPSLSRILNVLSYAAVADLKLPQNKFMKKG